MTPAQSCVQDIAQESSSPHSGGSRGSDICGMHLLESYTAAYPLGSCQIFPFLAQLKTLKRCGVLQLNPSQLEGRPCSLRQASLWEHQHVPQSKDWEWLVTHVTHCSWNFPVKRVWFSSSTDFGDTGEGNCSRVIVFKWSRPQISALIMLRVSV